MRICLLLHKFFFSPLYILTGFCTLLIGGLIYLNKKVYETAG